MEHSDNANEPDAPELERWERGCKYVAYGVYWLLFIYAAAYALHVLLPYLMDPTKRGLFMRPFGLLLIVVPLFLLARAKVAHPFREALERRFVYRYAFTFALFLGLETSFAALRIAFDTADGVARPQTLQQQLPMGEIGLIAILALVLVLPGSFGAKEPTRALKDQTSSEA